MSEPIVLSWSGGKDSAIALSELSADSEWEVVGLLTTITTDYDRISMHGVRRTLLHAQAESLGLPLKEVAIPPVATNEIYEAAMGDALETLRTEGVRHVAFGDLFLADIRAYRERLVVAHGLAPVFPVWKRDTREFAADFIARGFVAHLTCVDSRVLDESFAGRRYDHGLLSDLPPGVDPCGEHGEFHTFVSDGPNFSKPIPIERGEIVRRDSFIFCDLLSGDMPIDDSSSPAVAEIVPDHHQSH